ncbi:MAG: DNA repair protein RecO [Pseudomonadota bacterium]
MNPSERIKLQDGWVLHRRDFRDSSQIIEVFTLEYGRLSMVARGVKRPRSKHRGLLQPFSPLRLSWVAGRELATMTDVEQGDGAPLLLTDDRLLSGFYLNELVLKLTHRFDPQPVLYQLYTSTLTDIASGAPLAATLRQFEWSLLAELGFGLNLTQDVTTGASLEPSAYYNVIVDQGPVRCVDGQESDDAFSGEVLLRIVAGDWSSAEISAAARRIFSRAIDLQLEGKPLQSRRVLHEMRRHHGK